MKDKAFAKGVSRDDLRKGAEELGLPLDEHIGMSSGSCGSARKCWGFETQSCRAAEFQLSKKPRILSLCVDRESRT